MQHQPSVTVRDLRHTLERLDQDAVLRVVSADDGEALDFPFEDVDRDALVIAVLGNLVLMI